ncbi:TIGR03752 family integrating conjugative element protein [Pseudomonas sp. PS02302]|uniref:TIGR03752 family integrating conjugative element protein n=1 Tax=Pseudomonas sp. PS02302 TaxID=2991428 RepID=UPI00249C3EF6|nr:TIGR03752 family integrating conjugative element protein [Pseudomonas sp. PS02302]
MKTSSLLKWAAIPLAGMMTAVGLTRCTGSSSTSDVEPETAHALTQEERAALGVEGDSPRDTVATLVAQVKQLRQELETATRDVQHSRQASDRPEDATALVDQRIEHALQAERAQRQQAQEQLARERQQTEQLLNDVKQRLHTPVQDDATELPVGLGLEPTQESTAEAPLRWIEPSDVPPDAPPSKSQAHPLQLGLAPELPPAPAPNDRMSHAPDAPAKPVYTLPANATLVGSVAMTALIGRVPVDGTVNDPYPFKVLIGPDNLTANGIELPDVAGAVVSGTASGDWTLSCVRGQIRSLTFVFTDGTIRTLPDDDPPSGQARRGESADNALGWISDDQGIPCVAGERRSNAAQYLGSQALITAAGAGAASLLSADKGTQAVFSGAGTFGTTSTPGQGALNQILASGMQDLSQWVNRFYGQAFAAVYVKPGAQVAVHLERPVTLDYAPQGRRVHHLTGGLHAAPLD